MANTTGTPPVPVLILGTHITALGVLRILTEHGIPCQVLDETSDIIVRSRWYRPAERLLAETPDSAVLAGHLESLRIPRAVVIACSDRWSRALSGLPGELRHRFMTSMPSRETVELFVDKDRFTALVDRLGIPHPRTLLLRNVDDLDKASDEDLRVGFLKPTESQRYYLRFGTKGSFVHDRETARRLISQARDLELTFMLQEWIPGEVSNTILLDGFVDRQGTVRAMVARRRLRMDPPRIANTALDRTIPLREVAEAADATRAILAEVGYRGIFNIEFKHDARDGRFKVIEVNARPFWLIAHIARAGADLPFMAYRDAQDLPVPEVPSYQAGRYGMYEVPEIAALLRAWGSFRRPTGPVLAPWLRGDHTLLWWRDPAPGLVDLGHSSRNRIAGMVARLRSRRPGATT